MDTKDKKGEPTGEKIKTRVTLTCKNVKAVEKVCAEIVSAAKKLQEVKVKGPVRMPTKILKITVRKSPCGEGTNTFDRFEMRIFKRIIDLECLKSEIKQITAIKLEPGIDVELTAE